MQAAEKILHVIYYVRSLMEITNALKLQYCNLSSTQQSLTPLAYVACCLLQPTTNNSSNWDVAWIRSQQ